MGPGVKTPQTATPPSTVQADADGILHFGCVAGLFRYDPSRDRWHVYFGRDADETVPDWVLWRRPDKNNLPENPDVFLPAVTALLRGPDQSLWIGTSSGLARYRATCRRGTYATRLESFPELDVVPVHSLAVDERQRLWVGTDRGLLLFDGTHWFQRQGAALVRLQRRNKGAADRACRFHPVKKEWQAMLAGGAEFTRDAPDLVIANGEEPVRAMLWTDGAVARIGTLSPDGFTTDENIQPGPLRRRIKPQPILIVEGALPAVPRLEPGSQDFRYLSLEEPIVPKPRTLPAWTREGRLLPEPSVRRAPSEGRYLPPKTLHKLETVFSYNPAARVTFRWRPRSALSVVVRLEARAPDEVLPAIVYERVFASMDLVRPAGARVRLVHGETLVKGG